MENFKHHAKTILATVEREQFETSTDVLSNEHQDFIKSHLGLLTREPLALPLVPMKIDDPKATCIVNPARATILAHSASRASFLLSQFYTLFTNFKGGTNEGVYLVVTHCIEGIRLSVRYDSLGMLCKAFVYGDSVFGVDVTAHVVAGIAAGTLQIPLVVPNHIAETGCFEVWGTLYCRKQDFDGAFLFSSSAVKATLKLPTESPDALPLYFCATDIKIPDPSYYLLVAAATKSKMLEYLTLIGFDTPAYKLISVTNEEVYGEYLVSNFTEKIQTELSFFEQEMSLIAPYQTDGVLFSANDLNDYLNHYLCPASFDYKYAAFDYKHAERKLDAFVRVSSHELHAVVVKPTPSSMPVEVQEVVWEHVSDSNRFTLSAVVKFSPVLIDNMLVSRAVLGNLRRVEQIATFALPGNERTWTQELNLGVNPVYPISKGAIVTVALSPTEHLVPTVMSVAKSGVQDLVVPHVCQYCGAQVDASKLINVPPDADKDYLVTVKHKHTCTVRESQTISFVLHRLNLLNISPYLVRTLFELNLLPHGLSSMFMLKVGQLINVHGVSDEMAHNIVTRLDTTNRPLQWDEIARFLFLSAEWVHSSIAEQGPFAYSLGSFKTFKAFERAHKAETEEALKAALLTLPDAAQLTATDPSFTADYVALKVREHTAYVIDVINTMLKHKINVCTKTQSDRARTKEAYAFTPLRGAKIKLMAFPSWDRRSLYSIRSIVISLGGVIVSTGVPDIYLFHNSSNRKWHSIGIEKQKYTYEEFLDKFVK